MKITHIQASNFLGARAIDVRLAKPVALFAGKNGAGKSSLQEAIRMALTGETVRVDLKKDYGALVTDEQETGFVEVLGTDERMEWTASVVLPSGKGQHATDANLPFVLDAQRFARMDDKERRSFLYGLMGVKMDVGSITSRMLDGGCDAKKVEQIAPILRAGFDAASKEAANKASDAKASWKTATGGETWGKDKAPKWQPEALPADAEKASTLYDNAVTKRKEADAELAKAQQELGAVKAEAVSHLAGVKLLVLDRFDVLDLKGREDLLFWLDGMAADGEIDTALIFGTLKALPALNFDNIEAHWIENGAAGQLKEAA